MAGTSWYVVEGDRTDGKPRYEVHRYAPLAQAPGAVRTFIPQWDGIGLFASGLEKDEKVQARAQAFADRLNQGGMERERALREAQR